MHGQVSYVGREGTVHLHIDPRTGAASVWLDEPMDWPDPPGLAGMDADDISAWYLLNADDANADEQARIDVAAVLLRRP